MVTFSRTPTSERVRFSRDTKLSDYEKRRRSNAASEFLENSNGSNLKSDRYRSPIGSSIKTRYESPRSILRPSAHEKKSYELLGESPIRSIPDFKRFETDDILSSIKKKRYPLTDRRSRVTKPSSNRGHDGLLGSLTSIGSKLLQSVLYNENKDVVSEQESKQEIKPTERIKIDPVEPVRASSSSMERTLNEKFSSLESLIRELKTESRETVMDKLTDLKGEILNLRASQELINTKFEERYEELRIENELNKRKFEKLFTDLEAKRDELDKEKTEYIKLLQKETRKRYADSLGSDDDEYPKKRRYVRENAQDTIDKMRKRNKQMNQNISESISTTKKIGSMI
ncbi:hypothetical protein KL905_001123 [Ogataea polymorpha]|nr:hypothetical protein KL937_004370 [Ogataea polymorpha]KAG7892719.1 hypothetical protein KL936_000893 [Ogataea polymorpha]KAG7896716.1 hypothetical protein KL908_000118 [Ogataea polymorpha]KAG7913514.1 hypothetical protein KL907_000459 [Ogataea polymorpha]KAG7922857.1 hypothetical protein KL905_001123 [Ogataea polymorpha]